jgi:hypothetical protein
MFNLKPISLLSKCILKGTIKFFYSVHIIFKQSELDDIYFNSK